MKDLAQYVRYLLADGNRRVEFFADPAASIAASGFNLNEEQRAVLFAMDRALLVEWIQRNEDEDVAAEVFGYDFGESDSSPGGWWYKGDVGEDRGCASAIPSPARAESFQPARMSLAAAAGGGGWTDPMPQIWRTKPEFGHSGKTEEEIAVVAEGIVDGAWLVLSPQPGSKSNVFRQWRLGKAHVENFRRMYACTKMNLDKVPPGDYQLHVRTHFSAPLVPYLGKHFPVV
jgi:hypothetical protein